MTFWVAVNWEGVLPKYRQVTIWDPPTRRIRRNSLEPKLLSKSIKKPWKLTWVRQGLTRGREECKQRLSQLKTNPLFLRTSPWKQQILQCQPVRLLQHLQRHFLERLLVRDPLQLWMLYNQMLVEDQRRLQAKIHKSRLLQGRAHKGPFVLELSKNLAKVWLTSEIPNWTTHNTRTIIEGSKSPINP